MFENSVMIHVLHFMTNLDVQPLWKKKYNTYQVDAVCYVDTQRDKGQGHLSTVWCLASMSAAHQSNPLFEPK